MGHARFFIDAKPKRRHRYLFANKKTFTTISDEPGGKRTTTKVEASSKAELLALYEAGCRRAIAEGWKDFTFNGWQSTLGKGPKRPTAGEAERRFEAMSKALAAALKDAGGKAALEKKALKHALGEYSTLKVALGGSKFEHAVHFFAVDGVGLKKKRAPALLRPKADQPTLERWLRVLQSLGA